MTANAQAVVEASVVSNEQANQQPVLDEYGRDAAERTVELSPSAAENIDRETVSGKHQTYDDALHYVILRGLAEIKRQREAALKLVEKTMIKAKRDNWKSILASNPALVTDSKVVASMLKDLGVTK